MRLLLSERMSETLQDGSWHRVSVLPPFLRDERGNIPVFRELTV